MNQNASPVPVAGRSAYAPDEIDLVDLALVLVRRWRLMLAVFVLVVAIGGVAAALKGASYQYSAVIDIGQRADGEPLNSPEAVRAALANVILPAAAAGAADQDVVELAADAQVDTSRDSGTVVLRVVAPESQQAQVAKLFQGVRERLLAYQGEHAARLLKPLQTLVAARESELADIAREIKELEEELAAAGPQTRVLLVDRIGRLQEAQLLARQELATFRADIARIVPTRMSEQPQRSLQQEGISGMLILALAVVLGGMLAVFAAFFVEFASRVRARL